jgi:hypothetical protein
MIKESEFKYFYIKMLMKGNPEWFSYRIPEETSDHLRAVFIDNDHSLYESADIVQFLAYNKRRVLFRLADVLSVHFLWNPIRGQIFEEEEECEDIKIYFGDRSEPIESFSSDGESVFLFTENYRNYRLFKGPYIGFVDADGEELMVDANKVILMEIPEYLMLEGVDLGDGMEDISDTVKDEEGNELF